MIENISIGIIGCGNMGSAIVENLKKKAAAKSILVFDKDKNKQNSLIKGFGVKGSDSIISLVKNSDLAVIAVKPQDIAEVLGEIKGSTPSLVISIAAGIKLSYLESVLGPKAAIIRAMPNLNALIGESVTAISPNNNAVGQHASLAKAVFQALGEVVTVPESLMNAVTAISGSGPAFVAYLLKDLGEERLEKVFIEKALGFGIEPGVAKVLARKTISGTKQMLSVNFDPKIFIQRVSSKGGTTEAGMKVLEEKGKSEESLKEAIGAAEKRAQELAKDK